MLGAFAGCGSDGPTTCSMNNCVCDGTSCDVACVSGAGACNIGCGMTQSCAVGCIGDADCNVECGQTTSCNVDCANSASCVVRCPIAGCTVENCGGAHCEVTCGTNGVGTRTGTTVTCS